MPEDAWEIRIGDELHGLRFTLEAALARARDVAAVSPQAGLAVGRDWVSPEADRALSGAALDHQTLADRWGRDVLLEDIRRRLKCQQCGRRADRLMLGHEQVAAPDG